MGALAVAQPDRRAGLSKLEDGRARVARSEVVAMAAASLVCACVLATAWASKMPLPALGWAAAFLFLAVERDVRERRIPNWLTFPGLALAVTHGALSSGLAGAGASLVGAALALGLLLGPYVLGWFGAGDVKALMVLGALWGAQVLVALLAWAVGVGGVLALVWIALRGGLRELAARWWSTLVMSLANRRWTYFAPAPGSAAAAGIPFAVAVGLGVAAYQSWGSPWS